MARFVHRLLAWAALNGGGLRKQLPPPQPIVIGSLLQRRVQHSGKPSVAERRQRFIKDASD